MIINLFLSFAKLDDCDIISAMKEWENYDDFILAKLSTMILNRDLLRVKIRKTLPDKEKINQFKQQTAQKYNIPLEMTDYFVFTGEISNTAYNKNSQNIYISTKNGKILDVTKASDQMNLEALSIKVTKYFLCYPKEFD